MNENLEEFIVRKGREITKARRAVFFGDVKCCCHEDKMIKPICPSHGYRLNKIAGAIKFVTGNNP